MKTKQAAVSNLFFNVMCFKEGDVELTHYHPFNHVSFVVGKYELTLDGVTSVVEGKVTDPLLVYIARHRRHSFKCLESGFVACCHAQRMSANVEDILDDVLVPNGETSPDVLAGSYPLSVPSPR